LNDEISSLLQENGASFCGFADISGISALPDGLPPRAVSIAVTLDVEIARSIADGPTKAYQDEYDRVNEKLNSLTALLAGWLENRAYAAVSFPATVSDAGDSWKQKLRVPFQHKTAATRAGLGWIGKNALLLNKTYGSAFRLSTVVTDAPFDVGVPVVKSQCGGCTVCVNACPSGAIKGVLWEPGMKREEYLDARACYNQTCVFIEEQGLRSNLCGICVSVCPWTRRYLDRDVPVCH